MPDDEIADDEAVTGELPEIGDDDGAQSEPFGGPSPTADADGLLSYEVSDWSGESRGLLDSMLTSAEIRHFWQGTTLSVAEESEAETDAIIEEVLATATVALADDRDKAVYEVGEWSTAMQTSLAESLQVAQVSYEWDERGDLVVYADDEDAVDVILEAMPDPDDSDLAPGAEVDVQAVLTAAWRASALLVKDPVHSEAVVAMAEAADTLEHVKLPFGFEAPVWRNIVELACGLRDGLTGVVADEGAWTDDEVTDAAAQVRDAIRPYV